MRAQLCAFFDALMEQRSAHADSHYAIEAACWLLLGLLALGGDADGDADGEPSGTAALVLAASSLAACGDDDDTGGGPIIMIDAGADLGPAPVDQRLRLEPAEGDPGGGRDFTVRATLDAYNSRLEELLLLAFEREAVRSLGLLQFINEPALKL